MYVDTEHIMDIDICDENRNTVLIVAASQNCKKLVKNCLRRGANINATNNQGNTPAHQAYKFRYNTLTSPPRIVSIRDSDR